MKKLFLLSFILLIVNTLAIVANPVDQQTAKEIGARYLNASVNMKANVGEMSLAKTYFMDNGEVAFYVFNASKGFVIVSAQDVAIPILGYSDEGQFDANDIPEAMEWWLKDYAGQINYGLKERAYDIEKTSFQWEMVKKTGRMTDDREDPEVIVSPLLVDPIYGNIEWNQGKYYNDSCPEAKDAAYLGYHTYAGCVACSMSQIMRKWKWPETGEGDHTSTGKPDTLYVNFAKTNYDWANMPVALTDVHGVLLEGITETQRRAVNQLIYHAGVAVNMRYNASGSSAYSEDVATALLNFFKYSDELSFEKLVYNADQIALWKVKLRSSLNHGYPMYYSGATATVGHAFVCDGYRSDNYFHINWGYSGNMNSYFAIGALNYNPSSQYNAANDAIFNIHPRGTTTTFVITAASINNEYGTVEKTGTGVFGTSVIVSATPKTGYHFCYWSVDGVNVSEEQSFTFTAKYDQDIVAVFAPPYSINATAYNSTTPGTSCGTVTGSNSYVYGATCELKATPSEGYVFVNWTKSGVPVSTASTYRFKVTDGGDYVANFIHIDGHHVGTGAGENTHYPLTGTYNYSLSEQIFTSTQLGTTNTLLGSVSFFNITDKECTRDLAIFMKYTEKSVFSSTSDWISVTEEDKVFEGQVTIAASGWTIVDFENLFEYDGSSNVVLVVDDNTGATGNMNFKVDDTSPSSYVSIYLNSETNINPFSPTTATLRNYCRNEMYVKTIPTTTTFAVSTSVYPENEGTVEGAANGLTYGTSRTVIATPAEGYAFKYWTNAAGKVLSKDANYTFNVRNNVDLIANFKGIGDMDFANDEVKAICVANWDSDNDGELSYYEASIVPELGDVFKDNTTITSFDELQYFTRLTSISNNAFKGCKNLTSIVLPEDLKSIGDHAFDDCNNLASMSIPAGVTSIGNSAFRWCDGFTTMQLPDGLLSIGDYAFYKCTNLTTINIPNTVTTIGSAAFLDCTRLTGSLVIPNSVTTLDGGAFSGCVSLNGTLTLSESLTTINGNTFYNCSGLIGAIDIPDGVTSISYNAFDGCSGFDGPIIIGKSVGSIGASAFNGCSNVSAIITKRATPPSVSSETVFNGMSKTIPVYVPKGSESAYATATGWSDFSSGIKAQLYIADSPISITADDVLCVNYSGIQNSDVTARYIYFSNDSYVLTVGSGRTLTAIEGIDTHDASQLVINDGAQLVTSNSVKATLKKTTVASEPETRNDAVNNWYAISSPVNNVAISSFVKGTHNVYRYDEPTHYWEEYHNWGGAASTQTLANGRGYLYRSTEEGIEFKGDVNVGNAYYTLTYQCEIANMRGFHLIGNPYSHNIYKGTGGAIESSYLTEGFYTLNVNGGWDAGKDNETAIKPNEGILVQATSLANDQTLTVTNVTTGYVEPGSGDKYGNDQIMFHVENSEYSDNSYVLFKKGTGLNKIEHRNDEIPMIYVIYEGENFAIADVPENTDAIELGFEAKTIGQYTFSLEAEGQYSYMHLIDRLIGNDIDMLVEKSYDFIGSPSDSEARFIVRLSPSTGSETEVFAYQNGNDIIVSGDGELQIFDVTGRVISTQHISGVKTVEKPSQGVYIFRLVGTDVKTQKIIVK